MKLKTADDSSASKKTVSLFQSGETSKRSEPTFLFWGILRWRWSLLQKVFDAWTVGRFVICAPSALSSSKINPPGVQTLVVVANDPSDTDGATEADESEGTWAEMRRRRRRREHSSTMDELKAEREHIYRGKQQDDRLVIKVCCYIWIDSPRQWQRGDYEYA